MPLTFLLVATFFISRQIYERVMMQDNVSNLSHALGRVLGSVIGSSAKKVDDRKGCGKADSPFRFMLHFLNFEIKAG